MYNWVTIFSVSVISTTDTVVPIWRHLWSPGYLNYWYNCSCLHRLWSLGYLDYWYNCTYPTPSLVSLLSRLLIQLYLSDTIFDLWVIWTTDTIVPVWHHLWSLGYLDYWNNCSCLTPTLISWLSWLLIQLSPSDTICGSPVISTTDLIVPVWSLSYVDNSYNYKRMTPCVWLCQWSRGCLGHWYNCTL